MNEATAKELLLKKRLHADDEWSRRNTTGGLNGAEEEGEMHYGFNQRSTRPQRASWDPGRRSNIFPNNR